MSVIGRWDGTTGGWGGCSPSPVTRGGMLQLMVPADGRGPRDGGGGGGPALTKGRASSYLQEKKRKPE